MNKKYFYRFLQLLCIVYVFIPEFTDVIPFIGWLDEATAIGFVVYLNKKIKNLNKEDNLVEVKQ
jgi:uncharacterized membrane protein YkvA (DUF1232 family)